MLWPTSKGGTPVAASKRCTAASMTPVYSSMEPNTGSRLTATTGRPRRRKSRIQGFHKPRLHTKPWTSTTPACPRAPWGTKSASVRERNGCCQANTRGAARTSPHQARSHWRAEARPWGSRQFCQAASAQLTANHAAWPVSAPAVMPSASPPRPCAPAQALPASHAVSQTRTKACCSRASIRPPTARCGPSGAGPDRWPGD
jgi:hypothetical protein